MQLTAIVHKDGPTHTVTVTVPVGEVSSLFSAKLTELSGKIRLQGFRPGHAPISLLRKRYGTTVLGEALETVVKDAVKKALNDNALRPAMEPALTGLENYDVAAMEDGRNVVFTLTLEAIPEFALMDLTTLSFEKLTTKPLPDDVEDALIRFAKDRTEEGAEPPALDDEFAKSVGVSDMAALRGAFEKRLQEELNSHTHMRLKKEVMDALDAAHHFEAPPTLVRREYESIAHEVISHRTQDHDHTQCTDDHALNAEEESEYRAIAARRVRLGLVLAEIAAKNGVGVTNEELREAIIERARAFPRFEEQMLKILLKNEHMIESIRATRLEDKTVDFVLSKATITEKSVSAKDLLEDEEKEEEKPTAQEENKKLKTKAKPKTLTEEGKAKPEMKAKPKAKKKENI